MNRRSEGNPAEPCRIDRSAATSPALTHVIERSLTARAAAPMQQNSRLGGTILSGVMILQLVPDTLRQRLIADFVEHGGGWPVLSAAENITLLQFLALRLPDPSHAYSLCRMEIALACASTGAEIFVEPEYRSVQGQSKRDMAARIEAEAWACIQRAMQAGAATGTWDHIERAAWVGVAGAVWDGVGRDARSRLECEAWQIVARSARNRIERGRYASLVWFHAEPETVLSALHGATSPPVGKPAYPVLCGPGVPNLCRTATTEEASLWQRLPSDDTAPDLVERLLSEGIVQYSD
jgi:hypothetical protein